MAPAMMPHSTEFLLKTASVTDYRAVDGRNHLSQSERAWAADVSTEMWTGVPMRDCHYTASDVLLVVFRSPHPYAQVTNRHCTHSIGGTQSMKLCAIL